jgi:uncharacterized peroxidase-related enzyme
MSYVHEEPLNENNYPPFTAIKNEFGFVPNFYRAQTMRPDLIEAETQLVNAILIKEGALTRKQKEYIFLVCSGANLSTYCVTAHCEIVRMLGIEGPEPEQLAVDFTVADIPVAMKALLAFAAKLTNSPTNFSSQDADTLRTYGYTDQQIMETVVMVGLAKFANYIAFGLGTLPDFNNARVAFEQMNGAAPGSSIPVRF